MNLTRLKLTALLLSFCGSISLPAQTFTAPLTVTSSGNPVDFELSTAGRLIVKGNYGTGSLSSTDLNGQALFLWYPSKGAFLAGGGYYSGSDDSNIGPYSFAFGYSCIARGSGSVAFANSSSIGWDSFAAGLWNQANGDATVAMGSSCVAGSGVAIGTGNTSNGYLALALGVSSTASGGGSVAIGDTDTALSNDTTAIGFHNWAGGVNSTAMGSYTESDSYLSFALGTYNVAGGTSWNTWVATDPLFEIGNGTDSSHRSDALLINKNGNMTAYGVDNEMPNQTLVNSNSVLTLGLANGLYLHPDGSGHIGIGTSSPDAPLTITENAAGTLHLEGTIGLYSGNADFRLTNANSSSDWNITSATIGSTPGFGLYDINHNDFPFYVETGAPNNSLVVSMGGNVGIGATSPGRLLTIGNNASIDSSGNAYFGDRVYVGGGLSSGDYGIFGKDVGSNLFFDANVSGAPIGFYTNDGVSDAARLFVTAPGNVGVGTETPSTKLEVNGNAQVDGTLRCSPGGDLAMGSFTAGTNP